MYDNNDEWADDWADNSEPEVLPCPSCGKSVYEETQQCPHCGEWIMPHAASARTPSWVRIVGVIVAAAFLAAILKGVFRLF